MALFALGSGFACPLLFGSAWKLAASVAAGVVLSGICWRISTSFKPIDADEDFIPESVEEASTEATLDA